MDEDGESMFDYSDKKREDALYFYCGTTGETTEVKFEPLTDFNFPEG